MTTSVELDFLAVPPPSNHHLPRTRANPLCKPSRPRSAMPNPKSNYNSCKEQKPTLSSAEANRDSATNFTTRPISAHTHTQRNATATAITHSVEGLL